mmetsp:Transcript_10299/g.20439  ORF Transcript_10299/g.20439 Transcript_10299/m.20439 type:complete len:250 (-) Transcript_10299:1186-1935(-)
MAHPHQTHSLNVLPHCDPGIQVAEFGPRFDIFDSGEKIRDIVTGLQNLLRLNGEVAEQIDKEKDYLDQVFLWLKNHISLQSHSRGVSYLSIWVQSEPAHMLRGLANSFHVGMPNVRKALERRREKNVLILLFLDIRGELRSYRQKVRVHPCSVLILADPCQSLERHSPHRGMVSRAAFKHWEQSLSYREVNILPSHKVENADQRWNLFCLWCALIEQFCPDQLQFIGEFIVRHAKELLWNSLEEISHHL